MALLLTMVKLTSLSQITINFLLQVKVLVIIGIIPIQLHEPERLTTCAAVGSCFMILD